MTIVTVSVKINYRSAGANCHTDQEAFMSNSVLGYDEEIVEASSSEDQILPDAERPVDIDDEDRQS